MYIYIHRLPPPVGRHRVGSSRRDVSAPPEANLRKLALWRKRCGHHRDRHRQGDGLRQGADGAGLGVGST